MSGLSLRRWLVWPAILLVGPLCLGSSIIGQLGRWSDVCDLYNCLAPLWTLGGLAVLWICLALAKGRSRAAGAVMGAIAVLIGAMQIAPTTAKAVIDAVSAKSIPTSAPRLRLVQFNAYYANRSPKAAVDWLIAQHADIVVVEEGDGIGGAARARLVAAFPYHNNRSDLMLSKLPLSGDTRLETMAWPSRTTYYGGRSVVEGPAGSFTLIGVHLLWPFPPARQAAQRREFAAYLEQTPRDGVLVVGDLNVTPWSFGLQRFERVSGLRRVVHGVPTWPAPLNGVAFNRIAAWLSAGLAVMPIDHVFAGRGWRTVNVRRGPMLGSDHYPLVVDLAWTAA